MDIDDAESTEPLANPISTLNNTMGKLDNAIDVAIEFEKAVEARKNIVLNRVQSPLPSICMYTFHDTNETLNCIEFSPDSNLAASGFSDSFIKVWNLKGKPLQSVVIDDEPSMNKRLKGHSGAVFGLDFSPDNRYLLSCSEDRTVRLWSMETFTNLVSYKSHNQPIWDVAFSPNGQHFATASHDQTARLWSCDRMYPLRIMAGHMSDVDCVTFHPNGKYLLTGSSDKTCRMWDVNSGSPVRVMLGHMGPINCTSVSPDGRWLASAGEDSVVNIWDLGSGRRLKSMRGHGKASIYSLTWSADGSVLLSSGADNSVRVWDVKHNTIEAGPEPEPFNAGETSASGEMDNKGVGSKNPTLVDADGKKKKEIVSTPDHMGVYFTRKTPVYKVHLTSQNLCLAAGSYFGE
ncbi:WD40 repeat-like protein [Nadsonia fulvescens var. elongata DSM 6958]|uniref:WD40 repeat-like protein n=1 Tax=Nadsonia fulvescens var. elongata DSM 6958 TaxID=857566 RepID=A0A1E3PJA6_9ASCO|nr:WD40 repeat-like protein [Nadsonia fulvescens var. elongata DSM 6958]